MRSNSMTKTKAFIKMIRMEYAMIAAMEFWRLDIIS